MGSSGSKGGLHKGTKGSPQGDLEQEELSNKATKSTAKELPLKEGIKRLFDINANFTSEDTIFVLEDSLSGSGLTWLELGNELAGLYHIIYGGVETTGHEKDFKIQFGIEKDGIPNLLKEIILNGEVVSNKLKEVKGRYGYERVYEYKGKRIIFGIGTNGFITTAYYRNSKKGESK